MRNQVKPVEPADPAWLKLIQESHQTSLFVMPEWLELSKQVVIGCFDGKDIITGLVAREAHIHNQFCPYQGLLLSARSTYRSVTDLLDWLEGIGGIPAVHNAPSLVDVRPWYRRPNAIWTTIINYTYMTDSRGMASGYPEPYPDPMEKTDALRDEFSQQALFDLESVSIIGGPDGKVMVGKDLQHRHYVFDAVGDFIPVVEYIGRHFQLELMGTEGKWKKSLRPKLRTHYTMVRIQ